MAAPVAASATPHPAAADTVVTESALGGCVRVHHLWKPQLAAVTKTAAGSAERTEALLATVYRPYQQFWAGYLGAKDDAGFTRWIREAWTLENDPRRDIPLSADLGAMIVDATRRVATLMQREQACSDWYLVYGPGWTNMGGLTGIGMVADFLGMPRERGVDDFRAYLPHEVAHVAWGAGHRGDQDAGTLLERIVGEGFATWFSDMYWGDSLSAAQALGYSDEELQRAFAHEHELWAVATPLLSARDRRTLDRFAAVRERVLPGAPGKAGYFIGYRIVDAYVTRHGPESWRDLIDMPFTQILARSGYAPSPRR